MFKCDFCEYSVCKEDHYNCTATLQVSSCTIAIHRLEENINKLSSSNNKKKGLFKLWGES